MEFAFTAITTETGASLAIATKGERGYSIMLEVPSFPSYSEADDYANELNAKLGLSTLDAWKIVASSMRP